MQSAASTFPDRHRYALRILGVSVLALTVATAGAQGNSPFSRYGLGDVLPSPHAANRAMGGISAGDAGSAYINFSNPAAYSSILGVGQARNPKKLSFGRPIFDVGININSKTLREAGRPDKFTSSDINLSYIQVGIPLREGWGMVFGIRPVNRIGYQIQDSRRISGVDSVFTEFEGNGGAFLPTFGMGKAFGKRKNFSVGANIGYLFGNRETSNTRYMANDTVPYYNSLYRTNVSYGRVFFNFGLQHRFDLSRASDSVRIAQKKKARNAFLRVGMSGNVRHRLDAIQDVTIGTFTIDPNSTLVDTVSSSKGVRGTIVYPSSYTFGFLAGANNNLGGFWQAGADLVMTNWSEYRYFGATDAVTNNWVLRLGGQILPSTESRGVLSSLVYRGGFAFGKDYVTASGRMPYWSVSGGLGIPLGHRNPQARNQQALLNVAMEYQNRGNDANRLKENNFRLTFGLTLSDAWFVKRRYD